MAQSASSSAPGKILWLGGYAVVEKGCVGYVTAVDRRCTATAAVADGFVFYVPHLSGNKIKYARKGGGGKLVPVAGTSYQDVQATKFVAAAVETCFNYLEEKGISFSGISVTTSSDSAFASGAGKSGLGASAAVTVATTAAVLKAVAGITDLNLVHNISQFSHALAQGKVGSGFDVACSTYGTCAYSRYSPETVDVSSAPGAKLLEEKWDCIIEPLPLPPGLLPAFANILGESASTGPMVKKVMEWKEANPGDYADLINKIDVSGRKAIGLLKGNKLDAFKEEFEVGRRLTRELGGKSGAAIEPPGLKRLVDESLSNGAFCARLPGAGGGDAVAALCRGDGDRGRLARFWGGYGAKRLGVVSLEAVPKGVSVS